MENPSRFVGFIPAPPVPIMCVRFSGVIPRPITFQTHDCEKLGSSLPFPNAFQCFGDAHFCHGNLVGYFLFSAACFERVEPRVAPGKLSALEIHPEFRGRCIKLLRQPPVINPDFAEANARWCYSVDTNYALVRCG
jgi:hypothetical protein